MKKTLAVMLCLASFAATAQKLDASKVPAAVKAEFAANFPGVKDAKWEQEGVDYEAGFSQAGVAKSATFSADGKWQETESEIQISALPAGARKYLETNYKGRKVKEATELKLADGSTRFEAEVDGIDVIFDGHGGFVRTQKG